MTQQVTYRNFSSNAAENYERYFVPAIGGPVAGDLLAAARLQPGERVADVACGTGVIARRAAEEVGPTGTVVGVDVAPDMIEVAQSLDAPSGAPIEWRVADAVSLPLPDDSLDVVFCQMGLMFIEDKQAALSEFRRVLAPGGRLALNTPGEVQPPFAVMDEALARHISPDLAGFVRAVFSMYDPDAVARLVQEAGFGEVEARVATTAFRLPPPADFLWQYINLTPMGGFVNAAPEEAKAALEHEVVERWQPFVEGGVTLVDQPMVIATATATKAT